MQITTQQNTHDTRATALIGMRHTVFLHIIHITSKTQHAEGYNSAESGYE